MAISQAVWMHGHGLQSENPTFAVGRVGWGGQIKQLGSQGWYHLAIPTPVIVTDIRLRLDAAVIQFSGGSQGLIHGVHVYDGNNQICRRDYSAGGRDPDVSAGEFGEDVEGSAAVFG